MRRFLCLSALCALVFAAVPASEARARSIQSARKEVVRGTLKYLNIPYLWGGNHPGTGLDCSAFVQLVYRKAGLNLPRVSRGQYKATRRLSPKKVLPGDLIFFAMKRPGTSKVDHVGIYVGKGFFVHASVTHGVHVEDIRKAYYRKRLVAVRQYRGF